MKNHDERKENFAKHIADDRTYEPRREEAVAMKQQRRQQGIAFVTNLFCRKSTVRDESSPIHHFQATTSTNADL